MKPKLLLNFSLLLFSLGNAVVSCRQLEDRIYSFKAEDPEWFLEVIEERLWEPDEEEHLSELWSRFADCDDCSCCSIGGDPVETARTFFSPGLSATSASLDDLGWLTYEFFFPPIPEPLLKSFDWQYVWMGSLRNWKDEHTCGGTLVAAQVVLTAAHCFDESSNQPVAIDLGRNKRVGQDDSGFEKHRIMHVLIHKEYSPREDFNNDIALLVLDFPTARATAELASVSDCFESKKGCELEAFGWGILDYNLGLSEELRVVSPPAVNRTMCQEYRPGQTITANMLCAGNINEGGIGNCSGDSGGPVFILDDGSPKQVGIVSWSNGCGDSHTPEVMTSVPALLPWITEQLSTIDKKWSNTVPDCWQTQALCMEVHRV